MRRVLFAFILSLIGFDAMAKCDRVDTLSQAQDVVLNATLLRDHGSFFINIREDWCVLDGHETVHIIRAMVFGDRVLEEQMLALVGKPVIVVDKQFDFTTSSPIMRLSTITEDKIEPQVPDVVALSCATYQASYGSKRYDDYMDQVGDLLSGRKFEGFSNCNKMESVRLLCRRHPQASVGATIDELMHMPISRMPQVRCGA